MKKIKVLIIDTDLLVHQTFAQVLNEDEFEVAGIRGDTDKTQSVIEKFKPDVILLNIESTKEDDFNIFKQLRNRVPQLPVIILSRKNEIGAEVAISALRNGAVDFITKPEKHTGILFSEEHFEKRLKSIIKAAVKIEDLEEKLNIYSGSASEFHRTFNNLNPKKPERRSSISLVVIGSCLGGPHALFSLIPNLPANLSVPIVITQHFPKMYTKVLADRLKAESKVMVQEAYDDARLTSGQVWIAPGGYHTEIAKNGDTAFLKVHHGDRINDVRPNIDLLFESAARSYRKQLMGIILSGCGTDGLKGARKIKEAGGQLFVQNPRMSLAAEMPLAILKEGLANDYLDTQQLASEIVKRSSEVEEGDISSQNRTTGHIR